jgi:glycosyltransferase involved in cell wall biosynthesis
MVSEKANKNPFIDYKGSVLKHEVIEMMRQSRALLFPSLWYEGFPMVILEAISVGLPVIASHIGGIPEIIQHQHNGFLFKPGKVDDLYQLINQTGQDKKAYIQVRKNAHRDFKEQYSGEVNYAYLNKIYQEAMDSYQVGTVT